MVDEQERANRLPTHRAGPSMKLVIAEQSSTLVDQDADRRAAPLCDLRTVEQIVAGRKQ